MTNDTVLMTDMENVHPLAEAAGKWLLKHGMNIACAESCTGGLLTSSLTDIPGSSAYVKGSVVAYSNEIKRALVGVKQETLEKYGAVSAEVAKEMSEGVSLRLDTRMGIAVTGIAGPKGGTADKPVGLVYIAVTGDHGTVVRESRFNGSRLEIKFQSVATALRMLVDYDESF